MLVKEIIEELNKYNPEANFQIIIGCYPYNFEICYGDAEGTTKKTCGNVSFIVEEFNSKEESSKSLKENKQ